MNDTVRRRHNQNSHSSCHPEGREKKVTASCTGARSFLPGNIQSQLASAGGGFRRTSHRRRLVLATGIAILVCLTGAGCSGFFINPSISSIFITPSSARSRPRHRFAYRHTPTTLTGARGRLRRLGRLVEFETPRGYGHSPGGVVTGVSTGTATITASSQGVNGTASVYGYGPAT